MNMFNINPVPPHKCTPKNVCSNTYMCSYKKTNKRAFHIHKNRYKFFCIPSFENSKAIYKTAQYCPMK